MNIDDRPIQLQIGYSFAALVLVHGLLICVAVCWHQHKLLERPALADRHVQSPMPVYPDAYAGAIESPPVNMAAQNEIKHGILLNRRVEVVSSDSPVREQGAMQVPCFICPTPMASPTPPRTPTPMVPNNRYQIALFVDASTRSNQLLQWFDRDPQLLDLRRSCAYQIYLPESPLYKTRYASVIPRQVFPCVLFLRPDGGHVHAAGGQQLPNTAAQLFSDLTQAFKLSQSVMQADVARQISVGRSSPQQQNWIPPTISQSPTDCPDGICPLPDGSPWNADSQREPLFPLLRDRDKPAELFLWSGEFVAILGFAALGFLGLLALAVAAMAYRKHS